MRGIKLLAAGIVASLFALGLTACGGGRVSPPSPAARESVAPCGEPAPAELAGESEEPREMTPLPAPEVAAAAPGSGQGEEEEPTSCLEAKKGKPGGGGQADKGCYQLRPGGTAKRHGKRSGGRCEPQSLPYARCRSGIRSCNNGYENGPLTWFACEKKAGNTGSEARAGTVLILAANNRRKMNTGHVMYVEGVTPLSPARCKLSLSHTNYDRKCSKETKIEATYDRQKMTIDIHSGAWKAWGQELKVAGFILR